MLSVSVQDFLNFPKKHLHEDHKARKLDLVGKSPQGKSLLLNQRY